MQVSVRNISGKPQVVGHVTLRPNESTTVPAGVARALADQRLVIILDESPAQESVPQVATVVNVTVTGNPEEVAQKVAEHLAQAGIDSKPADDKPAEEQSPAEEVKPAEATAETQASSEKAEDSAADAKPVENADDKPAENEQKTPADRKYNCSLCGEGFNSINDVKIHRKEKHPDGK